MTSKPQSQELTQFYKDYLAWAEGRKGSTIFSDLSGLCRNLRYWLLEQDFDNHVRQAVENELREQFILEGLHGHYPFNNGSSLEYEQEFSCIANPLRIAWVRSHIPPSAQHLKP